MSNQNQISNINEELVNTLQIKTTIDPRTDRKFVQVGSTNYDKFVVVNPKLSTSQSWYNISQKIGNNAFTITNNIKRSDVDIYPSIIRGTVRYIGNQLASLDNQPILTYEQAMLSINPKLYQYSDQWEKGTISTTTGQPTPNNVAFPRIRTKNFIKIETGCDIASFFTTSSALNGTIVFYYNSAFGFVGVSSAGLSTAPTYNAPLNSLQSKYIKIIAGYTNSSNITPLDIEDFGLNLVSGYAYNNSNPTTITQSNEYRAVCSLVTNPFNLFQPVGLPPDFLSYTWILIGNSTSVPVGTNIMAYLSPYYPNGTSSGITSPVNVTNTSSLYTIINDDFNTTSMILQLTMFNGIVMTPMFIENVSLISNMPDVIRWNDRLLPTPVTYTEIRRTAIIPDGFYSGISSSTTQAGFSSIINIINQAWSNNFTLSLDGVPSYKTIISTPFPVTLFFSSTNGLINIDPTTTLDTSAPILGYPNKTNFINLQGSGNVSIPFNNFSPFDFDLFTDGRFYSCNVNLSLFGTTGFVGESNSLITFYAQSQYGKEITENDISYQKILPPNSGSIQNFTLNLTDANNNPIILDDRVFVRFEIQCYRKNKVKINNF